LIAIPNLSLQKLRLLLQSWLTVRLFPGCLVDNAYAILSVSRAEEIQPMDALEELLEEVLADSARRRWRQENPYVGDLIEILRPHRAGLSRRATIKAMEELRKSKGLPIPAKFDETVQSAFNQHCIQSHVFVKRKAPASEGLFLSPQGKGTGVWAVNIERAVNWLGAQNKQE
jgi:hypothetical protein